MGDPRGDRRAAERTERLATCPNPRCPAKTGGEGIYCCAPCRTDHRSIGRLDLGLIALRAMFNSRTDDDPPLAEDERGPILHSDTCRARQARRGVKL